MQFSPSFENGWDQEYDPFENPPQLERAIRHFRANMVGVNPSATTDDLCQCCYKVVSKKQLDMRCHQTQLTFLGTGIILFFEIAKITILLLVILMLPPIAIEFFKIYNRLCCQQSQIEAILLKVDLLEYSTISVTSLGVFFIIILVFLMKKYYDRQVYITQKACLSPSYYAIKMSNLPNYDEEELKSWIGHEVGEIPIAIHTAVDIQQMEDAFYKRQELTVEMHKNRLLNKHNSKMSYSLTFTDNISIDKRQRQILAQIEKEDDILNKYTNCFKIIPYKQTGVAIAIFQNPQKVRQFIEKCQAQECPFKSFIFERDYSLLKFKEKQVKISRAPAPKDIIWKNFTSSNFLSYLLINAITFLGKCAIIIGSIIFLQELSTGFPPKGEYRLRLIIIALAVYCLSYFLLHLLLEIESRVSRKDTYTQRELNRFQNSSFFSILLLCLIPYLLKWNNQEQILLVYCLILLDAGFYLVNKTFSFSTIYRKVFSDYIIRLVPEENPYTQDYLNRLMEGGNFGLGEDYYFMYRSLLVPVYFAHIVPLSFLIYGVALILEYWIEKYMLLRKCKIPPKFSRDISDSYMHGIAILPAFYVLGVYQFISFRGQTQQPWHFLVLLLFSAVVSFLLFIYFRRTDMIFQPKKSFFEAENDFCEFYELQNPIKKYNGEQKYKQRLLAKKQMINSSKRFDQSSFDEFLMRQKEDQETKCQIPRQPRVKLIHKVLSYNLEMISMNGSDQYKRLE